MHKLNPKIKNILKFLIFLGVSVLLFWLVYRGQNINELLKALKSFNYWWIGLALCLGFLCHVSRAIRWNMLIKPLGHKPRLSNTFLAVLTGYLVNFAIPRAGEVARCGVLKQYENISFTKLIGTVIIERGIDILMTVLILIIALFLQFHVLTDFFQRNPVLKSNFLNIFSTRNLIIMILIIIGLIVIFFGTRRVLRKTKIYQKTAEILRNFIDGIKTIKKLENKTAFIGHTLFIWIGYFLTLYICFFSFQPTVNLTLLTSLSLFAIGNLAMLAPVQGGIGAWHFMIIETLYIYGISQTDGKIFALVAHGANTFFLVILGFLALVLLPIINKKK